MMSENVSVGAQWTANQKKFIRWLATPSSMREHRTYGKFAESIGVAERTLYRWKDLDGLTGAVAGLSRELLADDLPEIYGALRKKARSGSFQHIKLALELAGEYVEEQVVTNRDGDLDARKEIGDRNRRIAELKERIARRDTSRGGVAGPAPGEGGD